MNRILRAMEFAASQHWDVPLKPENRIRKYTHEPYIHHVIEVANIVASVTDDEDMIIAALLHDTVEDTDCTIEMISEEFGLVVAEYVGWLTDVSKPADGNRAVRKEIDRNHTARAPAKVHTIKLADLISNTHSIVNHDIDFAIVYMKEKELLLSILSDGDPVLLERALMIVNDFKMYMALNEPSKGTKFTV